MNTNTLIIAGLLVVVVVGVSAFAIISDSPDDTDDETQVSVGLGYVYGNADGDFEIDADDVSLIKKLAEETDVSVVAENLKKFPMADVNRDSKIDAVDAELAQDIVDGKATKVFVIDDTGDVKGAAFPLTDIIVTGGTNMRVAISVLQMEDDMLAVATNKYVGPVMDKVLYEKMKDKSIVSLPTKASSDSIAELSKLDLKGAVLEEEGMGTYSEGAALEYFTAKGIEPLIFTMDNADNARTAIATLGILMGAEDRAKSYVGYLDGVIKNIHDTLGDKFGTVTVLNVVMSNSVSGTKSDYYAMSKLAGGNNIADWPETTKKFDPSKGDTWLLDPKYNPDYLIHTKSMVYGDELSQKDVDKYRGYFKDTKAYEEGNYYLMNGTMPLPARLAYMAEIMYPDIIEEGYGDKVFQQYFDDYSAVDDWNVSEHKCIWSVKDF